MFKVKSKKLIAALSLIPAVIVVALFIGAGLTERYEPKHVVGTATPALTPGATSLNPTAASSPRPSAASPSVSCSVSVILVNTCRPWLGGTSNNYGTAGDLRSRISSHEQRIGHQLDIVHSYHTPPNDNSLSAADSYYINRPNTILLTNWKPNTTWALAGGGDGATNAKIDTMARSIKAVAPHKIMLIIAHEPEIDVSGGAPGCPASIYKGHSGTPAEYRAMWQNVRNRFNSLGVTNVVWVMDYQGGKGWQCLQSQMYPGDALVDWVMWDPYYQEGDSFVSKTSVFVNFMKANTDSTHGFTSKPWGLGEWGSWQRSQSSVMALYSQFGAALKANTFPNIHAYVVYDTIGSNDSRIDYSSTGAVDNSEQDSYKLNVVDAVLGINR